MLKGNSIFPQHNPFSYHSGSFIELKERQTIGNVFSGFTKVSLSVIVVVLTRR